VSVALRYRAPYDFDSLLAHLAARAIDGVERVERGRYLRTVAVEGGCGIVEIAHHPAKRSLVATVRVDDVRALPRVIARIRRMFDLTADVAAIEAHLARDPRLAPLVAARPGLRVPGGWDGFEVAVRAILGQQISVEAARKLLSRLVALCGARLPARPGGDPALTRIFPRAADVVRADLSPLGMPLARRRALEAMAEAALDDPSLFEPLATVEETAARLRRIRGVGEWTAQYIAMRAAREPDAFPASDLGLLRAFMIDEKPPLPRALLARRRVAAVASIRRTTPLDRRRGGEGDGIFVPKVVDGGEIRAIADGARLPLNVLAWPGLPTSDELVALGVRRLSAGSAIAQAAPARAAAMARAFLASGRFDGAAVDERPLSHAELNALF
jgi:3-methyladenine DNA glycosylase/8-oxoguanine DNA glycosylase